MVQKMLRWMNHKMCIDKHYLFHVGKNKWWLECENCGYETKGWEWNENPKLRGASVGFSRTIHSNHRGV